MTSRTRRKYATQFGSSWELALAGASSGNHAHACSIDATASGPSCMSSAESRSYTWRTYATKCSGGRDTSGTDSTHAFHRLTTSTYVSRYLARRRNSIPHCGLSPSFAAHAPGGHSAAGIMTTRLAAPAIGYVAHAIGRSSYTPQCDEPSGSSIRNVQGCETSSLSFLSSAMPYVGPLPLRRKPTLSGCSCSQMKVKERGSRFRCLTSRYRSCPKTGTR